MRLREKGVFIALMSINIQLGSSFHISHGVMKDENFSRSPVLACGDTQQTLLWSIAIDEGVFFLESAFVTTLRVCKYKDTCGRLGDPIGK
jgi:hypothetical protein